MKLKDVIENWTDENVRDIYHDHIKILLCPYTINMVLEHKEVWTHKAVETCGGNPENVDLDPLFVQQKELLFNLFACEISEAWSLVRKTKKNTERIDWDTEVLDKDTLKAKLHDIHPSGVSDKEFKEIMKGIMGEDFHDC